MLNLIEKLKVAILHLKRDLKGIRKLGLGLLCSGNKYLPVPPLFRKRSGFSDVGCDKAAVDKCLKIATSAKEDMGDYWTSDQLQDFCRSYLLHY